MGRRIGREWDGIHDSHGRERLGSENYVGGDGIGIDGFLSERDVS
jgi:hypothetical protein